MTSDAVRPTQRVYLHIGVPKSGTSFLQAGLRANAKRLRRDGVLYPTTQHKGLFHAALELTGNHPGWGVPDTRVKGSWTGLCRKARGFDGVTVLSNELFSNVRAEDVPAALRQLEGIETHLVVTVRDLARQLPAEWQEGVKHGRGLAFPEFLRRMTDPTRSHEHARKFWRHQDLPELVGRWSAHLPAERIHVITCPPPGAPRELLWERFCTVVGIDPARTELPQAGANTSLGVTAIDVLRRVNRELKKQPGPRPPLLRRTVKQSLVNGALRSDTSERVTLPEDVLPLLKQITDDWRRQIEAAGYDVVGDLSELDPHPPRDGAPAQHRVPARQSRDLAVTALAVLTREVSELRDEIRRLESRQQGGRISHAAAPVARGGGLSLVRRTTARGARAGARLRARLGASRG